MVKFGDGISGRAITEGTLDTIIEMMDENNLTTFRISFTPSWQSGGYEYDSDLIQYFLDNSNYNIIVDRNHLYPPKEASAADARSHWTDVTNSIFEVLSDFPNNPRVAVELINEYVSSDFYVRMQSLVTAIRTAGYTNPLVCCKWNQQWTVITDPEDNTYQGYHFYFGTNGQIKWATAINQMNTAKAKGITKLINTEVGADDQEYAKFTSAEVDRLNTFLEDCYSLGVANDVWLNVISNGLNWGKYMDLGLSFSYVDPAPPDPYDPPPNGAEEGTWAVNALADDCTDDTTINTMQSLSSQWLGFPRNSGGNSNRESGIRLVIEIPPGASIQTAVLKLRAYASYSNTVSLRIYGEKNLDPTAFSTDADFQGRSRTTAYVNWNLSAAWTSGQEYETPDLSAILQEIIDQAGWKSGNHVVFFIVNNGTSSSNRRTVKSYDIGAGYAPKLTSTWNNPVTPAVTINLSVNNPSRGKISPDVGNHAYHVGDEVTLTADAEEGYLFAKWLGSDASEETDNPFVFDASASIGYKAFFQTDPPDPDPDDPDVPDDPIMVTVASSGGGSVTPNLGSNTYPIGATVSLEATASEGFTFQHWIKDDKAFLTDNPLEFVATLDVNYKTVFTEDLDPEPPNDEIWPISQDHILTIDYAKYPNGTSITPQAGGSLEASTDYYYRVAVVTDAGETCACESFNGTTDESNKTLYLEWNPVAGAVEYKIYRNTIDSWSSDDLLLATVTDPEYTDDGSATPTSYLPMTFECDALLLAPQNISSLLDEKSLPGVEGGSVGYLGSPPQSLSLTGNLIGSTAKTELDKIRAIRAGGIPCQVTLKAYSLTWIEEDYLIANLSWSVKSGLVDNVEAAVCVFQLHLIQIV